MRSLFLVAPVAMLALWAAPQDEAEPGPALKVGRPAPVVRLNDETGVIREIGPNEDGLWTVLAFYPKAATPG